MSITDLRAGTLLTVRDVAERLSVSPDTIEKWASAGYRKPCGASVRLKALRIGRSYRFHPAAVDAFIRAFNDEAAEPAAPVSA